MKHMAKQCHFQALNRIEILGASLNDKPAADAGPIKHGPDSGERQLQLRHLGHSLKLALRQRSGLGDPVTFSYSTRAAFCCQSSGGSAAIDCETAETNPQTEALRRFLKRLGCRIATQAGASSVIQTWTVFEALAKLSGKGICGEIIANDFSKIHQRRGSMELFGALAQWRSVAIHGHWLTVAWPASIPAAISITFLQCPETLPACCASIS